MLHCTAVLFRSRVAVMLQEHPDRLFDDVVVRRGDAAAAGHPRSKREFVEQAHELVRRDQRIATVQDPNLGRSGMAKPGRRPHRVISPACHAASIISIRRLSRSAAAPSGTTLLLGWRPEFVNLPLLGHYVSNSHRRHGKQLAPVSLVCPPCRHARSRSNANMLPLSRSGRSLPLNAFDPAAHPARGFGLGCPNRLDCLQHQPDIDGLDRQCAEGWEDVGSEGRGPLRSVLRVPPGW